MRVGEGERKKEGDWGRKEERKSDSERECGREEGRERVIEN